MGNVSVMARALTILAALSSCAAALASGGMEGGGGKTVVCRNANGSIRSVEILDLYEARTVYQLSYNESSVTWKEQGIELMRAAGLEVEGTSTSPSRIYDWYMNAVQNLVFLPEGTTLKPIDDSLEAIIPGDCTLEQTVNYQNDKRILVDGSIWAALSETQKAALMIHEATYRLLRGVGETDSRRARHFTGYIVSGHKVEGTFPSNNYQLVCMNVDGEKDTFFYAFKLPSESPNESEKIRLQFGSLGGRRLLSKAYVDVALIVKSDTPDVPDLNVLSLLKAPDASHGLSFMSLELNSLFEPGDTFDLAIGADNQGKPGVRISGTSIVDETKFGPINIKCYGSGT